MADENKKIVTDDILKLQTEKILNLLSEYIYIEEEYTDSEVDSMLDATSQEIEYYSSLINDELVSENRLYSSKKIAEEIANAIVESNSYSDSLLANMSSIELAYVTSLPATGNANTIYILKSTTSDPDTLNLYNDGSWIKIGDFNINLDDYSTIDYVNTKLADKANSSEVLAVNKVQTATGSETNDTVYSSKLTKDELDKKANSDDVPTDDYIKSLADGQITANSVDYVSSYVDKSLIPNMSLIESTYFGSHVPSNTNRTDDPNETTLAIIRTKHANCPTDTMEYIIFTIITDKKFGSEVSFNDKAEKKQIAIASNNYDDIYVRSHAYNSATWTKWKRLCSTSVADVAETEINTNNTNLTKTGECCYLVENGICYVSLWGIKSSALNKQIVSADLPNPKIKVGSSMSYDDTTSNMGNYGGYMYINKGGTLCIDIQKTNFSLFGAFSYPVAES